MQNFICNQYGGHTILNTKNIESYLHFLKNYLLNICTKL